MQALVDSSRRRDSVLVVGLDPMPSRLPPEIEQKGLPEHEAVLEFCRGIIEAASSCAAAIKLQAAYFERLGPAGMQIYATLIQDAGALDLPVIADVKRGDIGSVAAAYAEAHLSVYGATCATVNPYMGSDAVRPFLEEARSLEKGGGAFVLVATSNPSAESVQMAGDPPLYETAARLVAELGLKSEGADYPDAGAVVGVTRPEVGRRVRELLPDTLFLSPGYGAQGGGAEGVRSLLDNRDAGVLVNSSREIIYAHETSRHGDYREASREAATSSREALRAIGARL